MLEQQEGGIERAGSVGPSGSSGPSGGVSRRAVVATGAAVALASAVVGRATTAQAATTADATGAKADAGGLQVGVGKAVFTPAAALLPLDNFTAVHDDLYVRVLLVESGSRRIALAVLDLTSISAEAIALMRDAITAATGIAAANIMVTVTHCFSAPHVQASTSSAGAATYVQNIADATRSAVADAVENLQDAQVGYGSGRADVNVNRNVLTADGYWLGANEQLPSDKGVYVARFNDLDGNPIAVLANYNVQSCVMQDSVMADGTLPISADLAGAAVAHVEAQYPGAVGFWLVGACGDQFPGYRSKRYTIDKDKGWTYGVDLHDAGFALLTAQGERLGNEIVRVAQGIGKYESGKQVVVRLVTDDITTTTVQGPGAAAPAKTATFTPAGTAEVPLWVFQVGQGVFAGVEPELSTTTANAIRASSSFSSTFVMSMFEGGAKNMPDKWNYEHVTYEALDGSYSEGTAEKAAARMGRIIKSLK
ncbi:Protein of unknown function DUF2070, membrane [Actinobacteria bacterium OK074]|nr:Protein of unknown function DUF2070, membrane [Actinobacteria bacterium OK074]